MLITKLVEYASQHNLVDDPFFEERAVNWVLTVSQSGSPVGPLMRLGDAKRGQVRTVPKQIGRNSGARPSFATDNARFVLGLTDDDSIDLVYREAFASMMRSALTATGAENIHACAAFYQDPSSVESVAAEARRVGVKKSDLVALSYVGDQGRMLADTDEGRTFWRTFRAAQDGAPSEADMVQCLACGTTGPRAGSSDMMLKLGSVGGNPSGSALVSFDAPSFESFTLPGNANAAMCLSCSQAYTRALNHLLKRDNVRRTRVDEAGIAYVIWSFVDTGGLLEVIEDPPLDDDAWLDALESGTLAIPATPPDTSTAVAILNAADRGPIEIAQADDRLFVLGLRGNGGRAVVVEWFDVVLADARRNLARWFRDLQVQLIFDQYRTTRDANREKERVLTASAGELSRPIPRWTLARATARDFDAISPRLPGALLRAALKGDPLPLTVLQAALDRLRLEENGFGDYLSIARIGLVRCALNRLPNKEREYGPMLDPTNADPAYVCGRLLATLEAAQYQGVGDVGATIIDRFYGRASTAPRLVFGQLMSLLQSHLGAIDNTGARLNLEKEIEAIVALIHNEFPPTLSVEEQGRFAIGYWHQKAHRFAGIRERQATRAAGSASPTTDQENN
jgi:CRISPR-associated protein Csd1